MGVLRILGVGLLSAGVALACSCDSEDVAIPDSVVVPAQIQSAVIPHTVSYGSLLRVTVRVVEGCRFGNWEEAEVSFDSREIRIETRARILFDLPPDCEAREENHTVEVSYGEGKEGQALPQGEWDVFVVGRNTTVTGRVTVS